MKKSVGWASLVLAGAISGSAWAQTSPPPSPDLPSAAPVGTGDSAQTAMPAVRFVTDQDAGQFRASKFVGLPVYGLDNQRIGDISEIVLDGNGVAAAVVIGVGGFLGIGEKSVAVPFSAVQWMNTRPPSAIASGTGVIGSAVTAVTGGVGRAGADIAAPSGRTPAETAAFNGAPDHALLRMSKTELQGAPTFRYYAETHPQSGNAAPGSARPVARPEGEPGAKP